MILPKRLPPSPDNPWADSEAAADLGFRIFFDPHFSSNKEISCSTCHLPDKDYTDRKKVSIGLKALQRNAPSLLNAARHSVFFWDARVKQLWKQPIQAFEAKDEMNTTRVAILKHVGSIYSDRYEKVFGKLPALDNREQVDRAIDNIGRALEAYVRKISGGPSQFDRALESGFADYSPESKRGLALFFRKGCVNCHSGPNFTDETVRSLGTVAVRTPSLRNVEHTSPYGHDGAWKDLYESMEGHGRVLAPLSESEKTDLVIFLFSLTGEFPKLPWSTWPSFL